MSESTSRRFPPLREGEYALLQAECATGIVLTPTGERAIGDVETYMVFSSLESARQFARQRVAERPSIECAIYDRRRANVDFVRNEETLAEQTPQKKQVPWWRHLLSRWGRP
jgi:hypothetical protein